MNLKNLLIRSFVTAIGGFIFIATFAQEDSKKDITTGADFYSSYIWRGTKYGTGPAIQPLIKFSSPLVTAGAWGSFDFNGYQEADLFFSFSLPAGISAGMTDYYYPGLQYFDYSDTSGSHAFEINLGFSKGGLSLSANYILNEAGGAGSAGGDKYFEIKYTIHSVYLFAGAGDGWHSTDKSNGTDKFAICNLGIGAQKAIKITETFSIPVNGQIVFNPDREQMYIVVGFTL